MNYLVRNFLPADPTQTFDESPHASEESALAEYQIRSEAVATSGGGTELLYRGMRVAQTVKVIAQLDTGSAEWKQAHDRAREMGERDALAGLEPQVLSGDLAEHQGEYEDSYAAQLVRMAAAKGAN